MKQTNLKSELTIGLKILLALLVTSFMGLLSWSIIGVLNGDDQTNKIFTILITAATFVVATLQLYPNFLRHTWTIFRIPARYSLVIIVPALVYFFYWAFIPHHVIKIGVSVPLSGANKQDGLAILNAVNLAVNKFTVNQKLSGYTVEVVPFDDTIINNDSKEAPQPFISFLSDFQLAGVIGPFNSGVGIKEIPEVTKRSIAMISPGNTADCLIKDLYTTKCGDYAQDNNTYFRIVSVDSFRAQEFVKYLVSEIYPHSNIVIYRGSDPFSLSFAARLSEAILDNTGMQITPIPLSQQPQNDLKNLSRPPDIILYAGTGTMAIALHSAMQNDRRFSHTVFAAAATIMNGGFTTHLKHTASSSAYAIAPMAYDDTADERWTFEGDYLTTYDSIPTPYSASAYDSTMILLKSIERAINQNAPPPLTPITNATDFRKRLVYNIDQLNKNDGNSITYHGVTGQIHFAKGNGNVLENHVSIYHFDNLNKFWTLVSTTP